ncbi:MAG TPA: hypothetical protein VLM79_06035 [Kofleriaceae bacterium]|nr:hypothetical protein [Kofleriaceae bacterium]
MRAALEISVPTEPASTTGVVNTRTGSSAGTNWKNSLWWPESSSSITPQSRSPIGAAANPPGLAAMSLATSCSVPSRQIVPRIRAPSDTR